MKITELTALGIRIAGIVIAARAIPAFTAWIYYFRRDVTYEGQFDWLMFLLSALYAVVVLAMVFRPVAIAKWVIPRSSDESLLLSIDSVRFEAVALTILGLYLLSMALPDLAYYIMSFSLHGLGYAELDQGEFWGDLNNLVLTLVQMTIAAYLLIGAPNLLRVLRRLRVIAMYWQPPSAR